MLHNIKEVEEVCGLYKRKNKPLQEKILGKENIFSLALPQQYIDFISTYRVEGMFIGDLSFCSSNENIADRIELSNGKEKNPLIPPGFLDVAIFEADIILLKARTQTCCKEEVYFFDISTGFHPPPIVMADSFIQFIILCANLDVLVSQKKQNIWKEMQYILQKIYPDIPSQTTKVWEDICCIY